MRILIQDLAYNLRSEATHFKWENVKTTHCGFQSVRYLGPKIWDMVPKNIKVCSTLNKFKNSIKSWKPNDCLVKNALRTLQKIHCSSRLHLIHTTSLQYIGRKTKLYIFCIFWDFLYTFYICSLRGMVGFCLLSRWDDLPKDLKRRCISWRFPS